MLYKTYKKIPAPSELKLLCQQDVSGCCMHQQALHLPFPVPEVLPTCTKKKFQRQYVLESSVKKRISSQRTETPELHLLRRVPWQVWNHAAGRVCIPGAVAFTLVGVNRQVRGNWNECDGKER